MTAQYHLSEFRDAQEFLSSLATKLGYLRKGGVPDIHKAAQKVLLDWNNGRLTYFTVPPERSNDILSTELLTEMKEAFDIDALLNDEQEEEQWEDSPDQPSGTHTDEDHRSFSKQPNQVFLVERGFLEIQFIPTCRETLKPDIVLIVGIQLKVISAGNQTKMNSDQVVTLSSRVQTY